MPFVVLHRRFARLPLLPPLVLALACAEVPGPSSTVLRDSAGIEIVEHAEGGVEQTPVWELSDDPVLRIGVVEGDVDDQFAHLRDALRLADGSIVTLDEATRELRHYGPDGRLLRRQGREGEGPGEYLRPQAVWRYRGDSLAVWDEGASRISVLTEELEWVRGGSPGVLLNTAVDGALSDGRLLVLSTVVPEVHYQNYWLLGPSTADSVVRLLHWENVKARPDGGLDIPLVMHIRYSAAGGERILSTSNGARELEVWRPNGAVERFVRWAGPDLTAHPAEIAAYIDERVDRTARADRDERRRTLESQPPPATWPAFSDLLGDLDGNAWLMTWTKDHRSVPNDWTVVSPDGDLLGRVTLPPDFTPLDIGRDHVTGREVDELGVHYLVVYQFHRGTGGP